MANFENKQNASVPTEFRSKKYRVESTPQSTPQSGAQSTPQSTLQRNYNRYRYKPEQYDSDVDDSYVDDSDVEEVAIDEKFKLTDLEDGSYYIPCCSKIESRDEKKGGLLILMNVESGSFNNVIVSYRYVRMFRKLLELYKPYQIFVSVAQDEFTATNGYNAGNIITKTNSSFVLIEVVRLKNLQKFFQKRSL